MTTILAVGVVIFAGSQSTFGQASKDLPAKTQEFHLFTSAQRDSDGDLRLNVDQQELSRLRGASGRISISMPIDEQLELPLDLQRFSVTNAQSRFVTSVGAGKSITQMDEPNVVLLRGEIAGEPGSHAFLALAEHGAGTGSITRGVLQGSTTFHIGSSRIDGKASGLVVRSGPLHMPDFPEFCGTRDDGSQVSDGGIAGISLPVVHPGTRVIVVAIDGDQSFVQLLGGETEAQAYIVQLIGAVSDIYMRDLGFKLIIGFSRVWPEGGEPFSADDLHGFRAHWQLNEDMTGLNLVHMFSGRRDLPYGGIAFLTNSCSGSAFAISGFLLGQLPPSLNASHFNAWDVVVVSHEMGHNLSTPHTHSYQPPIDSCPSGEQRRGTFMSYCHTRPGGLLNIDLRMHARVQDHIEGNNPIGNCLWADCNGNNLADAEDIASGESADVNNDGVPDECQDCNGNGLLDPQEELPDFNANGIPDECEPDCDNDGQSDLIAIAANVVEDRNGNNVPDTCEADCDNNGVADHADILDGTHVDLDRNAVPDACQDCNSNGVPDWLDLERQFNFYVGSTAGVVREYHAASGVPVQALGDGALNQVYGIAFGPDRQLYAASYADHRVYRVNVDTGEITLFIPAGAGGLSRPSALLFGPNGNLFVLSQTNSSILEFDGATGAPVGVFVASGSGGLHLPWDLEFGPDGHLYVTSTNNQVLRYDGSTGAFIDAFVDSLSGTLNGPRGLTFLPEGHLLVVNRTAGNIVRFAADGAFLGQFNDEYPVSMPWDILLGPNGNVYVSRQNGSEIRVVEYDRNTGRYLRAFIRGDLNLTQPSGLAYRPASAHDANGNSLPDSCDSVTCYGDINASAAVDIDDLLMVINSWGPCPPGTVGPPGCPADIAPIGGNAVVNVNDLLAVVNAWGTCN